MNRQTAEALAAELPGCAEAAVALARAGVAAEDEQVEQALSARAHILREGGVDEDIDRRKEERVADAMQQLHGDDGRHAVREEGEHQEARAMAQQGKAPALASRKALGTALEQ